MCGWSRRRRTRATQDDEPKSFACRPSSISTAATSLCRFLTGPGGGHGDEFQPDMVHAHHPLFLGNTAVRMARSREVPLVFTHHTMWDQYTHYAASESPAAARFVGSLARRLCELCDAVIAPSQSVADMLRERGVKPRSKSFPTGVDVNTLPAATVLSFASSMGFPRKPSSSAMSAAWPGKEPQFLAEAVGRFLAADAQSPFSRCRLRDRANEDIRNACGAPAWPIGCTWRVAAKVKS